MTDERVLVIPRGAVMTDPGWYGIRTDDTEGFQALVAREGHFEPRAVMEQDRGQKQVIPYLVLRDGSPVVVEDDEPRARRALVDRADEVTHGPILGPP